MANLCPLCLKTLTKSDHLEARCPTHPDVGGGFTGAEDPPTLCPKPGCEHGLHTGFADLLCRHVECEWGLNPFWDGTKINVQTYVTPPGLTVSEPVSHWEVQALGALSRVAVKEMWFPVRLLIPVERADRRNRGMTLVSLCGAKNIGKTFIAMHALDKQGVPSAQENFIYCYPPSTKDSVIASAEFLQTLRLREIMANNLDFSRHLASTASRPRNLKVSFFGQDGLDVAPHAATPRHSMRGRLRRTFTKLLGRARDTLTDRVHALMLYDISGEAADLSFSTLIHEHDRCVDVVAVVISAEHITLGGPRTGALDSLPAALNRLRSVESRKRNQQLRCALVVTKSDLWEAKYKASLTEPEMRAALYASGDASAAELGSYLGRDVIDRVFFIHPDNVNAAAPTITGLPEFASWCATGY